MAEPSYPPQLRAYLAFVREVKQRHQQIALIVSGQHKTGLSKMFVKELAWLQIRMICESIALACLIVHEDIPLTQSKDLRKAYQADYILKKLGDLHPDYFPKPVVETDADPDSPDAFAFEDMADGFLTLPEMIKLYTQSSAHLHRGSIKSITTQEPSLFDPKTVATPLSKITSLLALHTIQPVDPKWFYLVRMANAKDQVEIKGYFRTTDASDRVDAVRRRRI